MQYTLSLLLLMTSNSIAYQVASDIEPYADCIRCKETLDIQYDFGVNYERFDAEYKECRAAARCDENDISEN